MEVIFRNVNFFYNYGMENEKRALKDINLCLESNLIHGIIGPIGSGKSTMLELMNGITKPTTGEIIIGKYNLNKHNFKFNKFRYEGKLLEIAIAADGQAFGSTAVPGALGSVDDLIRFF